MSLPNTAMSPLVVAARFRGPHHSGNGGYTAGALAQRLLQLSGTAGTLGQAVTVTLALPPPLDTPLPLTVPSPTQLHARTADGQLVAEAELADASATLKAAPGPVSMQVATTSSTQYRGLSDHPFPYCFSCGTAREPADALRLFAGPIPGRDATVAAAWTPHSNLSRAAMPPGLEGGTTEPTANSASHDNDYVAMPAVWAALDCPGAWATDFDYGRPIVLGRISAAIYHDLTVRQEYVVVGHCLRKQGRKAFTVTAVYDTNNQLMAAAEALWIAVNPATFAGLN